MDSIVVVQHFVLYGAVQPKGAAAEEEEEVEEEVREELEEELEDELEEDLADSFSFLDPGRKSFLIHLLK